MIFYLLAMLSKRASLLDTREPIKSGAKKANKKTTKKKKERYTSVLNSYVTLGNKIHIKEKNINQFIFPFNVD